VAGGHIATINVFREQSDRLNNETMRREWKLKENGEDGSRQRQMEEARYSRVRLFDFHGFRMGIEVSI